ncbi:MAG: hypothetical protein HY926_09530 [Elusimicrobia bacterium]|nr:hypothetical protein [Elusimicrobiota bacterium]
MLMLPAAAAAANPAATPDGILAGPAKDEAVMADVNDRCKKGTLDFLDLVSHAKEYPAIMSTDIASHAGALELYFSCLGAMPNPEQDCEALRRLNAVESSIRSCKQTQFLNAVIWKVFRSNDAAPACQKLISSESFVPEKDAARFCALFLPALKGGASADLCAKVKAAGIDLKPGTSCLAEMAFLSGVAACDSTPGINAADKRHCHDYVAFLDALRSGSPQACAASALCNAIANRKPQACAPFLSSVRQAFCAGLAARISKTASDKEAARKAAAAAAARVARQVEEDIRKAAQVPDPGLKAIQAKAAQDIEVSKEAARKKSAAEVAKYKQIAEIRRQRREAQMKKPEPPPQLKKDAPLQRVPPDVQKRLEAAGKAAGQ